MDEKIEPKKIPAIMVGEAYFSFELQDEFTIPDLADLAFNSMTNLKEVKITFQEMIRKVNSFVQKKRQQGLIADTDQKWIIKVNGIEKPSKVYRKVGELSEWKTGANRKIPPKYHEFVGVWNDIVNYEEAFTADEFHEILDEWEVPVNYEGQVGKFLWLIKDLDLCGFMENPEDETKNLYIRTRKIYPSILHTEGKKFFSQRLGEYKSKIPLIFNQ